MDAKHKADGDVGGVVARSSRGLGTSKDAISNDVHVCFHRAEASSRTSARLLRIAASRLSITCPPNSPTHPPMA